MQAMQVDEALEHADEWIKGVTLYEGAQGWRVACATLATEVRRLRAAIQQTLDENGHLADGDNCTLIVLKRALMGPNASGKPTGAAGDGSA